MIRLRVFGALVALASPAVASEPSLTGDWARGDGKTRVRIERCGRAYCAMNIWIRAGTRGEKVGDKLVVNVSPSGPSVLIGEGFDPQRNQTYSIRIEMGEQTMTTRGCVANGLLCETMSWKRLGSPAPD